jgi:hypothetical protein
METFQRGSYERSQEGSQYPVLPRTLLIVVSAMASLALVAGCAGSTARMGSRASGPVSAALAPAELSGTWHGSFGQVAASFYMDEGNCILQIKEDGTFTEIVRPAKLGTNNLAKASTWSGTVVTSGNRVTLRSSQGLSVTLIRSGNSLYGVAQDPLVEVTIAMKFQREVSAAPPNT